MEINLNCSSEELKKQVKNLRKCLHNITEEFDRRNGIHQKRENARKIPLKTLNERYREFLLRNKHQEQWSVKAKKKKGILTDFLFRWGLATGYMKEPSDELKTQKANWILFLLNTFPSEYTTQWLHGKLYYIIYFRTPLGQLSFHMPLDCEGIVSMKAKSKENPNAIWWGVEGHCLIVANRLDQDKNFVKKAKKHFKEIENAKISKKVAISA